MRLPDPKKFLSPAESQQLATAVEQAENRTSGEVKVVLVRHCWTDIRSKASRIFNKLNLDKTQQRNCVMILLVLTNREFLIYGDQGIHEKVGQDFWDDTRDRMLRKFEEDKFGEGLCEGVQRIGEKLAHFFPYQVGDKNEISDDIAHEE
ncbi:MAG: TPM domain-containing protein [Candidatus Lindowbacteria bacterium]|nr:TPM domain-containing protein [Candidatus Lindowbacteria bacterium]